MNRLLSSIALFLLATSLASGQTGASVDLLLQNAKYWMAR